MPAQHTPGPWRSEYCGREEHAIISEGTVDGVKRSTEIVAEIKDPVGYVSRAERSANARLIAAAPELLETLKVARLHIRHAPDCNAVTAKCGEPSGCDCGAAITAQTMANTIAKAEGRTP